MLSLLLHFRWRLDSLAVTEHHPDGAFLLARVEKSRCRRAGSVLGYRERVQVSAISLSFLLSRLLTIGFGEMQRRPRAQRG